MKLGLLGAILLLSFAWKGLADDAPLNLSGVYPHLRMWNNEGECGTGAVVPWQGDLWAITYAPHQPGGSSDKLYRITPSLEQIIFEGSVGGTPANRMIHAESNQLLIGPYLIDGEKKIRVIPPAAMFGRLTGTARHLTDPKNKVYYATMEEGLYEVDVRTLGVKCLIRDGNSGAPKTGLVTKLPGYHGKGLYSTQGRLVYANNGERGPRVTVDPTVTSGALAEWFGEDDWQLVRRNQFTEVTGPGGIRGNEHPESDPLWSMGWDSRSLILALLEESKWHTYRLPKGSHSYDGAHGWNTEWPRIREIGEDDLLATMHGTFWRFPKSFSLAQSAGIAPRSNYLKVIGDFCRWQDRVVFGCDDSAKAEFLNTRPFKASHGAPKQSNSNLWFVEPGRLDHLGPAIGRGSVWLRDDVEAGQTSDPYLFSGYDYRQIYLVHQADQAVTFVLEIDRKGDNQWALLREITVPAGEPYHHVFLADIPGTWIRLTAIQPAAGVSAHFQYRNHDRRGFGNDPLFAGIATPDRPAATTGAMRSLAYDRLGLVAATGDGGDDFGYYEINAKLEVVPVDDPQGARDLVTSVRQPEKSITVDAASVLLIEDGKRFRLPANARFAGTTGERSGKPAEPGKTLGDFLENSLARGASVRVSGTHQAYAAEHAVDGVLDDEDARWISRQTDAGWIELDFGSEKTIGNLWVVTGWKKDSQYVARNFDVQIRTGEDEWKTIPGGEIRDNHKVEKEIALAEPVRTRHLRIAAVNTGFLRVYEIAAFAERPAIEEAAFPGFGPARICREVATERDLLNLHGTFYELPARNAQGLAKVRPIATHNLAIQDFCSHNGLLFFTGIDAETESDHIFRSTDGRAAVWAGVIDDLWKLGKPRGVGGPWADSRVKAGQTSDPYLMTAYDRKSVELTSTKAATIALEVDIDGTDLWIPYRSFTLEPDRPVEHPFPEGFSAYWIRAVSDSDTTATVRFTYE